MAKDNLLPKWSTPERQAVLVALWILYGNRCLLGHSVCPEISHYRHYKPKSSFSCKPVYLPCKDKSGEIIRDKFLKLYKPVKVVEFEPIFACLYDIKAEVFIDDWKADDRLTRAEEYRLESIRLHSLAEPREPLRGQFSAISKDIFGANQPLYYLQALGISGVTLTPFAKVRISSSYMSLYVDLRDTLREVSKNKRRKATRYGKPLPYKIEAKIALQVRQAVEHYFNH